jgi:hypothetical protein
MKNRSGFVSHTQEIPYAMPKFVSGVGYTCNCGRPVEQAIEGEIICSRCWTEHQMDEDAFACAAAIKEYGQEQRIEQECPDCGAHSVVIGYEDCVEDVKMECPYCGIWWLWSKDAGNERYRKAGLI